MIIICVKKGEFFYFQTLMESIIFILKTSLSFLLRYMDVHSVMSMLSDLFRDV